HHYGGRIVKTIGDAFMSVFESPTNAVLCSIRAQYVLRIFNKDRPEKEQIHIRIALNAGEVQLAGDGDVFGEAVNAVARVEGVTPVDEIYFTERVYLSMNRNEVPETLNVKRFIFKGIEEEITVYKVQQNTDNEVYQKIVGTRISSSPGHALRTNRKWFSRRESETTSGIRRGLPYAAGFAVLCLAAVFFIVYPMIRRLPATDSSPKDNATAPRPPLPTAPKNNPAARTSPRSEPASPRSRPPASSATRSLPTPPEPVYLRQLQSGNPSEQRTAAKAIIKAKAYQKDPILLSVIREELLKGRLMENPDRNQLDALGWMCHVLGEAGQSEYRSVLEQVAADSPNEKLRRYAQSNLKKIPAGESARSESPLPTPPPEVSPLSEDRR
ncbi:MAG: adenylate/guanylate cyclase domain-containing protein, partial [Kiritimatiellia bacterium]|nr:adenylate/guanylate cyclase domain-containing protein [Kiritimatiellia bacterium]